MHEKGYDAPDPDNPAYRVIDPDEFFDYYEATGWSARAACRSSDGRTS